MAFSRPGSLRRVAAAGSAVLGVVLMWGCATGRGPEPAPSDVGLQWVPEDRWPAITDDLDPESFAEACRYGSDYLLELPPDRTFVFDGEHRTAAELAAGLSRASAVLARFTDTAALSNALKAEFNLYRSVGRDRRGEVLLTGYYEPLLEARHIPEPPFVYPVYGVPDDLVTVPNASNTERHAIGRYVDGELVPYPDRATIDFGDGLPEGTDVLGWVADRVDLFFLHVQGSGTLVFGAGVRVRAGYAASNGREYRSIGRLLIDEDAIPASEMSMQAIRKYLVDHPDEVERVLSANPRYVFFRRLSPVGGPLGCFGVPLTAGRSIATDLRLLPAPVPALLEGTLPSAAGGDHRFSRLVVHQDTGSSIVWPGLVDLFFGAGAEAGELAGRTKHLGELFVFLPKRGAR